MNKLPVHIQAAIDECIRLGVDFTYWKARSNKYVGIIEWCGRSRKLFMAMTPSDWRTPLKVRRDVRHIVNELRG